MGRGAPTTPALAFDHAAILAAALERVRGKLWWSNVAVGILPDPFTLADARGVYETIAATGYDPATFARDLRATGLIEPTGEARRETGGRPAALYRFARQDRLGRRPTQADRARNLRRTAQLSLSSIT